MKIHEYQAKQLLQEFNVPIPQGGVAADPHEAYQVAEAIGGMTYVVKAQIHAGGRGKGGGVKVAADLNEVRQLAESILCMTLVTHQTGPEGRVVKKVLVEQALDIKQELYLGIVIDRAQARPVIMISAAGGMEIEEVAARTPELIIKEAIDPAVGLMPYQTRNLAFGVGLEGGLIRTASGFITNLYRLVVKFKISDHNSWRIGIIFKTIRMKNSKTVHSTIIKLP